MLVQFEKYSFKAPILFLIGIMLFSSCDLFKPARDTSKDKVYKDKNGELDEIQGRKVYNPETGEWEIVMEVTEKMDTINWVELPPNKFPPITSEGVFIGDGGTIDQGATISPEGSIRKSVYNLSYILPFNTQYFSEDDLKIDRRSSWAINFYGGAKLAFDELREEGINLNVNVLDSKGDETTVRNIIRSNTELGNSDVVIGPYRRNNVRTVADWSRSNNVTHVSPFSASMNLTSNNPNFLQINPSIKQHCFSIAQHILEKYQPEEVVLVARDIAEEKERLQYFHQANYEYYGTRDTVSFTQYLVKDETADFHEMDIAPFINPDGRTVFVVPSYKSQPFIYSILRQLAIAKQPSDEIVVYGLPPWQNYTRVDFDYYENLNVHISSSSFVDHFDPKIRLFKRKFFDRFGTPPKDEAFLGYDVTLYTARMLQKYGTKFQLYLEQEEPSPYLETTFSVERVVNDPDPRNEQLDKIDQFENKFVHILKFSNYYFQPAD